MTDPNLSRRSRWKVTRGSTACDGDPILKQSEFVSVVRDDIELVMVGWALNEVQAEGVSGWQATIGMDLEPDS